MKNNDRFCFKYAILAGLFEPSSTNPSRVSSYSYTETLDDIPDFNMLEFPVSLRDISKLEKANDVFVNVYGVEEFGRLIVIYFVDIYLETILFQRY